MDFFGYQDIARRKTVWLVGLFIAAVILIVLSVYLVFVLVALILSDERVGRIDLWQPDLFLWIMVITACVVLCGSLWKMVSLSRGGGAIAEMLGGRLLPPNSAQPDERKLLNVVEEMAIASGVPVPQVYLLEHESSINAFAAGTLPANAVIGVTRGAALKLSRDELQGVIGHEFSHILNGDMRLNVRLMAILHGILVIALIGYAVLRGTSRIRGRKAGAAILLGLAIGLSLLIIGYVGVFFGRLIKSAVSRQREFLADASSVQFTRNPSGLAGALKKIVGASGSKLENLHAEEASHIFFSNALKPAWFGLLSTHPPLEERIRRLDPQFTGGIAEPTVAEASGKQQDGAASLVPPAPAVQQLAPASTVARIGTFEPAQIAYAGALIAGLPDRLRAALRDPFGAQAAMLALLLPAGAESRQARLAALGPPVGQPLANEVSRLVSMIEPLGRRSRLPLIDLALPALKQLSRQQYEAFREAVCALIEADQQVDLFEFSLNHVLLRHLDPHFLGARKHEERFRSFFQVQEECSILLSALAHVGSSDSQSANRAFMAALPFLSGGAAGLKPLEGCDLGSLDAALERLAHLTPQLKKRLLEACAASVAKDGQATPEELELLRAIADALDCPMPPFVST